jgi:hypothetical protein
VLLWFPIHLVQAAADSFQLFQIYLRIAGDPVASRAVAKPLIRKRSLQRHSIAIENLGE